MRITAFLVLVMTSAAFAGGRESDGGNGVVIRILMARQYAMAIVNKAESVPATARQQMLDVLRRQPMFYYDIGKVTVADTNGAPVVVSARIDAKTPGAPVEFNVPYIEEQLMSVPETTALYLHEAAHVPGLSKCTVKSKAELQGDIGLDLVMKELASDSNIFASHDLANKLRLMISRNHFGNPELPHGPAVRLIDAAAYQVHSSAALFEGRIRVLKLGPNQKRVRVHYGLNGQWRDAEAELLRDTMDGYEDWGFRVRGDLALVRQPLRFAIHYEVAFGIHDSWDNNSGSDYLLNAQAGLATVKGRMADIDGAVHLMHAETAYGVPLDLVPYTASPERISGSLRVRHTDEPKKVLARFWHDRMDDGQGYISNAVEAHFVRDLGDGYEEWAFNWDCSNVPFNERRAFLAPEVVAGSNEATSIDTGHARYGGGYDLNWGQGIYAVEGR